MDIEWRALRGGAIGELAATSGTARPALCMLGDHAQLRLSAAWILVIVLHGKAEVRHGEEKLWLEGRQWLTLSRDAQTLVRVRGAGRVLVASGDAASLAMFDPGGLWLPCARGGLKAPAGRVLQALRRSLTECGSVDPADAEGFLRRLLDGLTPCGLQEARVPGRTALRRRQLLARMLRGRLYIEGHADRVVRITELARLCSFSPWHFTKTFHQLFGETPQAFGARTRLLRARELVRDTQLAICEVAAACGFENASSFARAFHDRFGESASRLRARARAAGNGMYGRRIERS
ncbi:helix-turn-helix transcriptional regulator [Pseudomarimonas salicorniae]|uniref:Helix-turn-helix transcriptional regulator n=1 Tax=Pseudomarimonas salicorniae TaxID=2933270 RepID=A0ABT0GG74_9GAMM|nr:helix-turn-helix transcriptional regulator [Lysobacter sp. CAU 1642]MCK7593543.1 helix-turn-helix transcriptional regulator [Lysobacter sp. CAU 1642]